MQEIYLHPCDLWFGSGEVRLRTVLGSCVAITLWHPASATGGMCHFMMSQYPDSRKQKREGCYADSAMAVLQEKIRATGRRPQEFVAKLFGAGKMFCGAGQRSECMPMRVQQNNIAAGRELTEHYGHRVVAEHLGGRGHRQLVFDITTGLAWLKHTPGVDCERCDGCISCAKERAI